MSEQEKNGQEIYDLLNAERKISEIIRVSLWSPLNPDFNPLDYYIWGVLENKQKLQLPIQIVIRLRLL